MLAFCAPVNLGKTFLASFLNAVVKNPRPCSQEGARPLGCDAGWPRSHRARPYASKLDAEDAFQDAAPARNDAGLGVRGFRLR